MRNTMLKLISKLSLMALIIIQINVVYAQNNTSSTISVSSTNLKDTIRIVGIKTTTNNSPTKDGKSINAQVDIMALWGNYFSNEAIKNINNRTSNPNIYVIYTNYKDGIKGDYDVIIGVEVTDFNSVNAGLSTVTINAGKYLDYKSVGVFPNLIADAWKKVWSENNTLNRIYTTDFEIYNANMFNKDNSPKEMHIMIAVK